MSGDKEQTTGSSAQGKYEATVLDFLDKEATEVRHSKKSDEYNDELNALVSDLLKQVMEEADQKSGPTYEPDKVEDLLAEFMPLQEAVPAKAATNPEPALHQESTGQASSVPEKKAVSPELLVETKAGPTEMEKLAASTPSPAPGSLFAASAPVKRGFPKIAIAIAGVLLIAGIAGFLFFSGSNRGAEPVRSAAVTASAPPADAEALQSFVQPVAPAESARPGMPAPRDRSVAESIPAKVSAPAPKNEKTSGAPFLRLDTVSESLAPAPQRIDPPAAVATVEAPAPALASATVTAPIEKAAVPAISEAAKTPEASLEKAPAQDLALVSASPAGVPPEPKPSAAAAPKNAASAIPLVRANPKYPELALRTRASASVTLDVSIDSQGKVVKAIPVSGPSIFHSEAIKAAMKWRYKPASIDGTNVSSQSTITFNFNLKK
ncbi:MAG: TonB family protein [Acidobacteriota bacterium]|nr:TonB family protein [Acidobacteriota bacterium]